MSWSFVLKQLHKFKLLFKKIIFPICYIFCLMTARIVCDNSALCFKLQKLYFECKENIFMRLITTGSSQITTELCLVSCSPVRWVSLSDTFTKTLVTTRPYSCTEEIIHNCGGLLPGLLETLDKEHRKRTALFVYFIVIYLV